jgi:hypothetical protein
LNFLNSNADGFGEKGRPATGEEGAVPPNATICIELELVSWRVVTDVGDDKKIFKRVLKEGGNFECAKDAAPAEGMLKCLNCIQGLVFDCLHYNRMLIPSSQTLIRRNWH